MAYRILIADDSAMIRRAIRSCVEQNADWQVCGEAETGQGAVEKVEILKPDVVILDLQMPVMNGLEAAKQISRIAPRVPMLMFTMHSSAELVSEANAIGIREVVSKGAAPSLLVSAIRSALATTGLVALPGRIAGPAA